MNGLVTFKNFMFIMIISFFIASSTSKHGIIPLVIYATVIMLIAIIFIALCCKKYYSSYYRTYHSVARSNLNEKILDLQDELADIQSKLDETNIKYNLLLDKYIKLNSFDKHRPDNISEKVQTENINFSNQNTETEIAQLHHSKLLPFTKRYVILDFETTGLNPQEDRVIEIGALKIEYGNVVEKYSTLVNPHRELSSEITSLTGLTTDMLLDAPSEAYAFSKLSKFIADYPLVAYNASFDIGFLKATFLRNNIKHNIDEITYYDALKIAKEYFIGLQNYKLQTVVRAIDRSFKQTHRATSDCEAVKLIIDDVIQRISMPHPTVPNSATLKNF